MSHPDPTGFGKFVPGFDFLQNLGKGAAAPLPAMEQWNQWVAPTLDAKALDKRIEELKAVQFWLDQNATALKATIQALEVQKLTLATLKGMNFNPADLADALTFGGLWKFMSRHKRMCWEEVVRSFSKARFCASLQKLVPEITEADLEPGGAGVRAQALGPGAALGGRQGQQPAHHALDRNPHSCRFPIGHT